VYPQIDHMDKHADRPRSAICGRPKGQEAMHARERARDFSLAAAAPFFLLSSFFFFSFFIYFK
jgi:hypothetical protein